MPSTGQPDKPCDPQRRERRRGRHGRAQARRPRALRSEEMARLYEEFRRNRGVDL